MQYAALAQKHEWGCGIACVASRLGISYEAAKERLEKFRDGNINKSPKGLNLDPIVHVLRKAKIKVVADWYAEEFPVGTIVLIYGSAPYEAGHYLLRVADGLMDPWANMPERKPRAAKIRKSLPKGTEIEVALLSING